MKIHIEELKEDLTLVFQDGSTKTYEAKKSVPRSWKEFVKQNPLQNNEFFINNICEVEKAGMHDRQKRYDKNLCKTMEEAEAFLALMQLRRLWHSWCEVLGHPDRNTDHAWFSICYSYSQEGFETCACDDSNSVVIFNKRKTAEDFLECFKDLLEKARILL